MGTFHINLMFSILYDTDRIEANNLHDGICDRLLLDIGGHAEVFKFIIDKGDVVISGLCLNIFQGFGKRNILKGVRDFLCACNRYDGAQ